MTSIDPSHDRVDVWIIRLDLVAPHLDRMKRVLSERERERAARFQFDLDRDYFVARKAALRMILSAYSGEPAERIDFDYGAHGKPALASAQANEPPRFSASHSQDIALVALTLGRELGVDVELLNAERASDRVAKRFFAAEELRALESVAPEGRLHAFYRCWTAKEAYIKAVGKGLTLPLDSFAVSIEGSNPPTLLRVDGDPSELGRWRFERIDVAPDYVATLAVERDDWTINLRTWPGTA